MTNRYVYSGAAGAGTGADWTNAFTTLAAALTGSAAGDNVYVAHDHSETQASVMTLTSPGTQSNPVNIYCVNRAGTVPPVNADLRATGIVAVTGANVLNLNGFAYCYGVIFRSASTQNVNAAAAEGWLLDNSRIEQTSGVASINVGSTAGGALSRWKNTTLKFSNVGSLIAPAIGLFEWKGGSVDAASSAFPTSLITAQARGGSILVEGVDLSALGSGKTLFTPGTNGVMGVFKDCKLNASVTRCATPTSPNSRIEFENCDSGSTNYLNEIYDYCGTMTVETTIVRTGGASDGTTPIAHKIVTTANAKPLLPMRGKSIVFWNETVGSPITITVQGIWGGGAAPNNDDAWLEVEYPGDSGSPLASYANDGKANLASNAAQTAGSGTWGGSTTKFSFDVTITPQKKGPITLTPMFGAASSTFYIDPKPVIT